MPGAILPSMALILVVEDDRDIADTLELYLRNEGHRTERAADGRRALELWRAARPDLVLLDLGLPELGGLEVLKRIRRESSIPVIAVTARTEDVDELLGLELGADDYVRKPFSPRTLMARIRAVLRRSGDADDDVAREPVARIGRLEVDAWAVEARIDGRPVDLTPTEFRLLETLAAAPGKAMRRDELQAQAMPESDALERAVDVHLKNLRHKLAAYAADDLIETVRGVGYRLRAEGAA